MTTTPVGQLLSGSSLRSNMMSSLQNQYLRPIGWVNSFQKKSAIDAKGNPLPWYTYSAIQYLSSIIKKDYTVFEYGSGNSTLWWRKKAKKVVTVEHDAAWHKVALKNEKHRPLLVEMNSNVNQKHYKKLKPFFDAGLGNKLTKDKTKNYRAGLLSKEFKSYVSEIYNHEKFDVIVVDGMARVMSAWVAMQCVKDNGIIVFDNSDRSLYDEGYKLLSKAGYKRIDFWGLGPINPYGWCTSIFLKDIEALN